MAVRAKPIKRASKSVKKTTRAKAKTATKKAAPKKGVKKASKKLASRALAAEGRRSSKPGSATELSLSAVSPNYFQKVMALRVLPEFASAGTEGQVGSVVAPTVVPASTEMLPSRLGRVDADTSRPLAQMDLKVPAEMDPRLQVVVANHQTGKGVLRLSSTTGDEVAVVARVKDVATWQGHSDVQPGAVMGEGSDNTWIVTGRIPIARVEDVHANSNVVSLKASQSIHPELSATISAMAVAASATSGKNPQGGKGVMVGIVDFGCDFAHKNFRFADGKTRLHSIWHQAGIATPTSPHGYGRVYTKPEINAALTQSNPYDALGYAPPVDTPFQTGTHGTHVMDIAAGNGRGSGQPGVAPEADLVFVELSATDIPWDGPKSASSYFGDSVQLLEAVRYVFDVAGDRPCVCNLSLGTNGGPHDGTSLVERGLDLIVQEKPNRAIVIAASNSQGDKIHASDEVPLAGPHDLEWKTVNGGGGEIEIWYPGQNALGVTLIAEDGTTFGPVQPGNNLPIGSGSQVALFIINRVDDPNNHDNVVGVWLAPGLPGNKWTLRLSSLNGTAVPYHAWIERNDNAQGSFVSPDQTHTLGSISTGQKSVVVASYDAHKPELPLSSFSSSGPTRDGRQKPEIAAPGQNVMAARSRTLTGVVRKSGTSMASPAVTGLIALMFAEARRKGQNLSIDQLRAQLLTNVALNPPAIQPGGWHARFGFGRASGSAI